MQISHVTEQNLPPNLKIIHSATEFLKEFSNDMQRSHSQILLTLVLK